MTLQDGKRNLQHRQPQGCTPALKRRAVAPASRRVVPLGEAQGAELRGLLLGEGATMLVLESEASVVRRGATPLAIQ